LALSTGPIFTSQCSYTCILRHLHSELANSHKCPICAVSLCAADLKTVFYTQDAVEAVFEDTDTVHSAAATVRSAAAAVAPDVVELHVGQECGFQLLQFTKGSLTPAAVGSSIAPVVGTGLRGVLPDAAAANARYSRISYLTVGMMRKLFEHDQQTLLQYRQQCLPSDANNFNSNSSSSSSSNGSATTNAAAPKVTTSVWGTTRAANAAESSSAGVSTAPTTAADSAAPVWGSTTRLQHLLRQTSDGSNSTPLPLSAAAVAQQQQQQLMGGDVEALPFIALALERQQLLESDFEAKLALQPLPVQPQRDAVDGLVRQSSGAGGGVGGGAGSSSVDASSATYYVHQHPSGSLLYLHPICTKCLVEASLTADATAGCALPPALSRVIGKVLEIEHLRVSAENKQRYTVLRHLPLHSEVTLVEIDVVPLVPPHVLGKYSEELHKRANKRRDRAKQEKREKRMEHDKLYVVLLPPILLLHVLNCRCCSSDCICLCSPSYVSVAVIDAVWRRRCLPRSAMTMSRSCGTWNWRSCRT
jgi:hypothetical protein